jgi:hypothetical protein
MMVAVEAGSVSGGMCSGVAGNGDARSVWIKLQEAIRAGR